MAGADALDLLENASDLIQSVAIDGRILYANRAWRTTLGYGLAELSQIRLHDILAPDQLAHCSAIIERLIAGEEVGRVTTVLRKRDGQQLQVDGSISVRFVDGTAVATRGVFRVVTAERAAARDLNRFFTLSLDMLCIASAEDGRFLRLNPAFGRTLGYTTAELLARPFIDFVHPDDRDATIAETSALTTAHETVSFVNRYVCKDGSLRWLNWSAASFPEQQLIYAAARDITDLKETEDRLRQALDTADYASRAKSDFLASMSHELRTPLNSVIGFANILRRNRDDRLDERELNYLDRILANGKHLLSLINDVLDLAKVEAGKMTLELEDVELGPMIADLVAEFEGQVRDRNIELVATAGATPVVIRADPKRLRQILINLVGNAVKFTRRGRVEVRLTTDADGQFAAIAVIDSGPGIPEAGLDRVFELFEQADSSTGREHGGTGLGLSLARRLARAMGLDIEVESQEGVGSTFRVVPIRQPDDIGGAAAAPTAVRAVLLAGRTALVIDDDADARTLIADALAGQGMTVEAVADGVSGLAAARAQVPDVVVLDLRMPGMDGWEVLRQLRADSRLRKIPVVVASAIGDGMRGALVGVVDVLSKPFDVADLEAAIQRNLVGLGRVMIVDDDADARRILTELVTELGFEAHACAGGRAALAALPTVAPDLVLLDLRMPDLDGAGFLAALRVERRWQALPVVVVTAEDPGPDDREWLRGQTVACLTKGPDLEDSLATAIRQALAVASCQDSPDVP